VTDASLIQIPLTGGLDESVDDLRTPASRMRRAQNLVFRTANTASKRYGFANVPGSGLLGGAVPTRLKRIMNCNGVPAVTDGQNLYGYTPFANGWSNHGRVSPCIATRREVSPGYTRSSQVDPVTGAYYGQIVSFTVAEANGMRAIIWTIGAPAAKGGGTYAQVIDTQTGESITPATLLNNNPVATSSVVRPNDLRACSLGTIIQVALADASHNLVLIQYDTTTRTWSAPVTSAFGAAFILDMAQSVGSTDFFVAICNQTSGDVSVTRFSSAMGSLAGSTVAFGLPNVPKAVAIRVVAAERAWVAWSFSVSGVLQHVDMATLSTTSTGILTGPFTAISVGTSRPGTVLGIERTGPSNAFVVMGAVGFGTEWAFCSTTASLTTNGFYTVASTSEASRYLPMAKPFMAPNGRVYVLTIMQPALGADGNGYGASLVLLEMNPSSNIAPPAAILAARSAANDFAQFDHIGMCDIANIGDQTQTTYRTLGIAVNSSSSTGITECTFDFAHPGLNQAVTLGQTTYLCGGTLMSYDGQKITDTGFTAQPPRLGNLPLPGGSTTGGNLGPYVYKWISLYRYRTNRGETDNCLPPTFDPLVVSLVGTAVFTNTVNLRVACLNTATYKEDGTSVGNPVVIDIYRNAFSGGIDSGHYYKCASIPNLPLQPTIDFIDTMGDDMLVTQPLLYTTGNALESDAPPSIRNLCVHNQRLFGLGDEANVIWYTTTFVVGEKPRWNDALKLNVPAGDGDLVALASLDGRLYAFTSTATYVFTGDGPNDTGAGESWSVATKLPFGLGCTDPRAICVTPMGVVFMSKKGLYLYDRSGQAQWIGERIQRTLALYSFITSIVHYEADGYVLVTLSPTSSPITAAGTTLCWDYRHDAWTTWAIGSDAGASLATVSAESVGGTYYALFNGTVMGVNGVAITKYTPGTYFDGSTSIWITLAVDTGWISQQDLQSYGRIARIQLVGQFKGQHGLELVKWVDYSLTIPDSLVTFPVASLLTIGSTLEKVRTGLVQQKCQSVSLTIVDQVDVAHPDTGQSIDLEGILFKLRVRGNEYKRLANQQAG
jgi:type II secretory pathway pseudopilin PulG